MSENENLPPTDLPPPPPAGDLPTTPLGHGTPPTPPNSAPSVPQAWAAFVRVDPELIPKAVEMLREHGAAETARRLGLEFDVVRAIAAHGGVDLETYDRDVDEARARLDERAQLNEVRRLEARERLQLACERAVERLLRTLETGSAAALPQVSKAMRDAYAELRLELGELVPASDDRDDGDREQVHKRALEIRDELAARRAKARASGNGDG